jgi:hypothetical protein
MKNNEETQVFVSHGFACLGQMVLRKMFLQESVQDVENFLSIQGYTNFTKSKRYLKILDARRVACCEFHTEDP